jgi:hypothetical protein
VLGDPPDHGLPVDLGPLLVAPAGQELAGERPVERIGELDVKVADQPARLRCHRAPAGQDAQRLGERVEADPHVRQQLGRPRLGLGPEPRRAERPGGARPRRVRIDARPVRAGLVDAQRAPQQARVRLGDLARWLELAGGRHAAGLLHYRSTLKCGAG